MGVKIKQALQNYIQHYFDFSGYTSRPMYWWALGSIYVLTCLLGVLSGALNVPYLMVVWLSLNIIPLLSLQFRRLRDVGFQNQGLVFMAFAYVLMMGLFIYTKQGIFAFLLEILALCFVLLPILKSDELLVPPTSIFHTLLRHKK